MPPAQIHVIGAQHPEPYKIGRVAEVVRAGGLILYPTDTVYALGCDPRNADAIRRLRGIHSQANKLFTLICRSVAEVSEYCYFEDQAFKLIKTLTPGPYTFILKASKAMPRLLLDPKRKTAGMRIPDNRICHALMNEIDGLLISSSARLPNGSEATSIWELFEELRDWVDVIVDDEGDLPTEPSTVIDLSAGEHIVVREGKGLEALAKFSYSTLSAD